jgi:hypothetical protein
MPVSTNVHPSSPSISKTEIEFDSPIASTRYIPDAIRSGTLAMRFLPSPALFIEVDLSLSRYPDRATREQPYLL